jgi:uncharacterized membrane protein YphA (DoxX/SURF4 family)
VESKNYFSAEQIASPQGTFRSLDWHFRTPGHGPSHLSTFFGSILLGLGLFTRPVAAAFLIEVIVISFGIAAARGFFWTTNGSEITLLMAACFVGFIFGGGGRYSVDRAIGYEF